MNSPVLDFIETLLGDKFAPSWHQVERHDLGVPEDCQHEALLCIGLEQGGAFQQPVAFVLEKGQTRNTLSALREFLREGLMTRAAIAVVDYMPPLDEMGAAQGASRRWVLDSTNKSLLLPQIENHLRVISGCAR